MRKVVIFTTLILTFASLNFVLIYKKSNVMHVRTTRAERGEIHETIDATGMVISERDLFVSPTMSGKITSIKVKEGDSVEKGDLLAQLDRRETRSLVNIKKEVLRQVQEEMNHIKMNLESLQRLSETGAVPSLRIKDLQTQLRLANIREQIASEELQVAQVALNKHNIVAPFSGFITSVSVQVGQWVVPGQPLLRLVDPSQYEVEVKIEASDSASIKVGFLAVLSTEALPEQVWEGKVTQVAFATNREGSNNTLGVRISLGLDAPSLLLGQQVEAKIHIACAPNAIKLLHDAVISKNKGKNVAVIREGHVHYLPVVTGIQDLTHIEVLQGIEEGQEVIIFEGKNFKEGDSVVSMDSSQQYD